MILSDEAATAGVGEALANLLQQGDVVTLSGPLGAGKTTLVRAMLRALGEQGEVPSPSFALVQPYDQLRIPVWHADLYRLENAHELANLGLDEVLREGALVIEWPERAPEAWPQALALSLELLPGGQRRLTGQAPAAWNARWPLSQAR